VRQVAPPQPAGAVPHRAVDRHDGVGVLPERLVQLGDAEHPERADDQLDSKPLECDRDNGAGHDRLVIGPPDPGEHRHDGCSYRDPQQQRVRAQHHAADDQDDNLTEQDEAAD
jgi:hypothetical protein